MTYAPDDLLAAQRYCHDQTGQDWSALGIIHSTPQGGGYHEGEDLLIAANRAPGPQYPYSDYSYTDSPRDLLPNGRLAGGNAASAFDLGGGFPRFLQFNAWMRAKLLAGDPRAADVREMIHTLDGRTVRRIDRAGVQPDSGDNSHLSHTHFDFFRDSLGRRDRADNFLGLLREFFEGVPATTQKEIEMHRLTLTGNIMDATLTGPSPAVTGSRKVRLSSHWGDCRVWVYIRGVEAGEWTIWGKDSYLERDLPAGSNFAFVLKSVTEARAETDPPTHCAVTFPV